MKVIFAGTPDFAVVPLRALIRAGHEVIAVFTQPDRQAGRGKKLTAPPVKCLAQAHSIDVFQPESLADQAPLIAQLGGDVMVVVAYGVLLPQAILDIPPYGCLNIHASILPRWRGAAPIQRAIEAGEAQTGVSIMHMELGLDTGPVYRTFTTDISNTDTANSLHDKLAELGAEGICKVLEQLPDKNLSPRKQDSEHASYARKISKDEADINWNRTAEEIDRQIRAFNPWPICQTFHNNTRIRIWQASLTNNQANTLRDTGEIVNVASNGIEVNTKSGTLRVQICQRDGAKPLNIAEFCNGYSLRVGDRFTMRPSPATP